MVKSPKVCKGNMKLKKVEPHSNNKMNSGNKKYPNNKKGSSNVECVFPNIQTLVSEKFSEEEMLTLALTESVVTAQIAQLNINEMKDEKQKKIWQDYTSSEEDRQWTREISNNGSKPAECKDGEQVDQRNKISHSATCPFKENKISTVNNEMNKMNSNKSIDVARPAKDDGVSEKNADISGEKYKHEKTRRLNEQSETTAENSSEYGERIKNQSVSCKQNPASGPTMELNRAYYSRKKKPIFIENSTSSSDDSFDRRAMRPRRLAGLAGKQVSTSTPISLKTNNNPTNKNKSTTKTLTDFKGNKAPEGSRKTVCPRNIQIQNSNTVRSSVDLCQRIPSTHRSAFVATSAFSQNLHNASVNPQNSVRTAAYNVHACNRTPTLGHSCTPQGVHSCSRPVVFPTPTYYANQPYPMVNHCNSQMPNFNQQNPETKYNNVPTANYFPQQYVQVINPHYTSVESHVQGYQYGMPYGPTVLLVNPMYGSYYPTQETFYSNSPNYQPAGPEMVVRESVTVTSEIDLNGCQNGYISEQKQQPTFTMRTEQPDENTKMNNHDFLLRPVENCKRFNCLKDTHHVQVPLINVRDGFEYEYPVQDGNLSRKIQAEGRIPSRN